MDIDCMARGWVDPETGEHVSGARVCVDVADGASSTVSHCAHPDGGVVLVQYISAEAWPTVCRDVASRAPDAPLVSQLDAAGMRDCLREAAVAAEGD